MKKHGLIFACILVLSAQSVYAQRLPFKPHFTSSATLDKQADRPVLKVAIAVKEGSYVYADKIRVISSNSDLASLERPPTKRKYDPFSDIEVETYQEDFVLSFAVSKLNSDILQVEVNYQGCSDTFCFPEQTDKYALSLSGEEVNLPDETEIPAEDPPGAPAEWQELAEGFKVAATYGGYLSPEDFAEFLDASESENENLKDKLLRMLGERGMLFTVLFALLGGLLLNLTPCVLPMIPVNLAIIGAGAQSESRTKGFLLGGTYGLGMALAYGLLGLGVVRGLGAGFGTIQSMPAFNLTIALLFIAMALAMFGVFNVDLTRLQGTTRVPKGGKFLTALLLGSISAILAGACVAPAVIVVLTHATTLYGENQPSAQFLPFILGLGMALPWPFAGAGLSFLPKPGKWMNHVKHGFGVFILLFGIYYGVEGIKLLRHSEETNGHEGWNSSLAGALEQAKEENKPVFIDLWASWCKSCIAMDQTTFAEPDVQERLSGYVLVKFPSENPKDPAVKQVWDYFGVIGLPFYAILQPDDAGKDPQ